MSPFVVVLFFVIIGAMRVVQKVCDKKASVMVNDRSTFFHYGMYYQAVSGIFAVILLFFVGFEGFDWVTLICAASSALLFAVELYASIEAIKVSTLMVCQMVSTGGLLVPCVTGIFLFNEAMSLWQWLGLAMFMVSVYFLASDSKKEYKAFTKKTFIMLLLCFLSGGLVMVVQKYFAIYSPQGNVALYSALTFGLNALFMGGSLLAVSFFKKKKEDGTTQRLYPVKRLNNELLVYGGLLALALFAINQLVTTMAKSVSSAILFTVSSALSILITCIVGTLVFKEKITVKKIIGIVVGFASIVIVSVL